MAAKTAVLQVLPTMVPLKSVVPEKKIQKLSRVYLMEETKLNQTQNHQTAFNFFILCFMSVFRFPEFPFSVHFTSNFLLENVFFYEVITFFIQVGIFSTFFAVRIHQITYQIIKLPFVHSLFHKCLLMQGLDRSTKGFLVFVLISKISFFCSFQRKDIARKHTLKSFIT